MKKFYEETNIRNAQIDENVCTARLNMSYAKSDIQVIFCLCLRCGIMK